jgi:hypothetical protein
MRVAVLGEIAFKSARRQLYDIEVVDCINEQFCSLASLTR